MSPGDLRLSGSPVNLNYRYKNRSNNNNNRPKSAIVKCDILEDHINIRPYSADRPKNCFSKNTNRRCYNKDNILKEIYENKSKKKFKPAKAYLMEAKKIEEELRMLNTVDNHSDHGSEDTYVSLGTKIKSKAEEASKINKLNKDNLRLTIYERKNGKIMQYNELIYDKMEKKPYDDRKKTSEAYFIPLNNENKAEYSGDHSLKGRVSFGFDNVGNDSDNDIIFDKRQLSLVEEESTQDCDSIESQAVSSSRIQNDIVDCNITNDSLDDNNKTINLDIRAHLQESDSVKKSNTDYSDLPNNIQSSKHTVDLHEMKRKSELNNYTDVIDNDRPLSLESIYTGNDKRTVSPYLKNCDWNKDEGFETMNNTEADSKVDDSSCKNTTTDLEYPTYLLHDTNKTYTSKVIEDYKKEIAAINNLHELTLKDIKSDVISPTPMNIDELFEETKNKEENKSSIESLANKMLKRDIKTNHNKLFDKDVCNISTREIIENYLKVKESPYKKIVPSRYLNKKKSFENESNTSDEVKTSNQTSKNTSNVSKNVNNRSSDTGININLKTLRNNKDKTATMSSRIESVQHDKDVESWISTEVQSLQEYHENTDSLVESNHEVEQKQSNETNNLESITNHQNSDPNDSPTNEIRLDGNCNINEQDTKAKMMDLNYMLNELDNMANSSVHEVSFRTVSASTPKEKNNYQEIFSFLDNVEHSADEVLSFVATNVSQTVPKLESLLRLPQTELSQRLITACLQLEERSCCIALLQESLSNHKEQMLNKLNNMEKQHTKNIAKIKQDSEEAIKRHQKFIDQLINDKKSLNQRIEQLVEERRNLEDKWKRNAQALEERYKLELKNQHDRMLAAQQVARQRWVKQKAEKIKELTLKGMEGELREMADRQQHEYEQQKLRHAEIISQMQARHTSDMERLRNEMAEEREAALARERQQAHNRMEKQMLELESLYQEQRATLIKEMRAENDRTALDIAAQEKQSKQQIEQWRLEQERSIKEKLMKADEEIEKKKELFNEQLNQERDVLRQEFEAYKQKIEREQQVALKRRVAEIETELRLERDREIERAIDSMEMEAQAGRRDLAESIRRNKELYEAELKELAETEQATLRRYQEAQARVRRTEDKCADLEVLLSQSDARNRVLSEKVQQLEQLKEKAEQSAEERWLSTCDTLKRQIDELKTTHEEQMQQLYAKVKVAVARKDSALQALTKENEKAKEKLLHLEQRLQQQRKDFLNKKH